MDDWGKEGGERMSANSHQESPWMGSVGIGMLLLGLAGGILALSFIGYSVTHSHAIWTGGRVATILVGFYGLMGVLAGLVNSSVEAGNGDGHDDHGHDEHAHHGSFSPFIVGVGILTFLYGFVESYAILVIGLLVILLGAVNWWREDYPNDGKQEIKSLGQPYKGQDVRKVGLWVLLMSEILIFGSFFSSYLRMRMGWSTHWNEDCNSMLETGSELPVCSESYVIVASEYVTHSFWTLLPGAINTFALILSSYTVVLALKSAKAHEFVPSKNKWIRMWMPDRRRAVRNNLLATLALGTLFLILKLIEWEHLIYGEDFTVKSSLAGSIFYVSTGAHGFHVFVGLIFLCYFCFKAHNDGWQPENSQSIEYFGLYWHFVDLAWVAIFPAFYLY